MCMWGQSSAGFMERGLVPSIANSELLNRPRADTATTKQLTTHILRDSDFTHSTLRVPLNSLIGGV